ncbi:MAG: DUF4031 domain-containing protein [Actinomycetota bacterium]|nr:DUF4031 domain-containing protein [Actinomycetota bacterium]
MTIWIDPPLWPAHGRLWSHLISDTSLAELHDFARRAGIDRRSFEGDHYDVPAERHQELVRAGARLTSGTMLARRLRDSGLRFRKRKGERPLARVPDGLAAVGGPHTLDVVASSHEPPRTAGASVVVITDPQHRLVLVRSVSRVSWSPPGGKRDGEEGVRAGAVREVAEETGLHLSSTALVPLGYERITVRPGDEVAPWDTGDNHIAVFGIEVPSGMPVAPHAPDVAEAQWVTLEQGELRCGSEPWWPLVSRWLDQLGSAPAKGPAAPSPSATTPRRPSR